MQAIHRLALARFDDSSNSQLLTEGKVPQLGEHVWLGTDVVCLVLIDPAGLNTLRRRGPPIHFTPDHSHARTM